MSPQNLSQAASPLRPGISRGHYPERALTSEGWLQKATHPLIGLVKSLNMDRLKFKRVLEDIHQHGQEMQCLDKGKLFLKTRAIQQQLHRQGLTEDLIKQSFALVREIAGRTIDMRHFDSQLMGGWVMINGNLAEMETGEGKTLTATLAAATAALAGIPVHIVTVNDYLVTRDAKLMGPVYQALGLSVGAVTATMDAAARRDGYHCNITYCTNKQLAFDYLRDRILLGNDQGRLRLQLERLHSVNARTKRLFLRGLCFAIIDEADSVLIDEARTPLIISRKVEDTDEEKLYRYVLGCAQLLKPDVDFRVDLRERAIEISQQGSEKISAMNGDAGEPWKNSVHREELLCQALSALYLYKRDHHYLVHGGRVKIIDENTGRIMADRSWERGLHQMIEIKENCEISSRTEHLARMTYQRFFRRYLRLAGMTGTAREVCRELWAVYHLPVVKVNTHRACQRKKYPAKIYENKEKKWAHVVRQVHKMHRQKRPVLIGTRSVADSEHLSRLLQERGMPHQVLNARQDAGEAEIIAGAGAQASITVATNMAGRGTDIPLGSGVAETGGLHVISTEKNAARRIDRQLYGRCGRQGDPGSYRAILSLEDELPKHSLGNWFYMFLVFLLRRDRNAGQFLSLLAINYCQLLEESRHRRMRRDLLKMDEQLGQLLAFSGQME